MNGRVKLELSGLFINQQQCDNTIQSMKITLFDFTRNFAVLLKRQLYKSNYNEMNKDAFAFTDD